MFSKRPKCEWGCPRRRHESVSTAARTQWPRGNAAVGRFNRTLQSALNQSEVSLKRHIQLQLVRYQSTPHCTTGKSPSELLHGRIMRQLPVIRETPAGQSGEAAEGGETAGVEQEGIRRTPRHPSSDHRRQGCSTSATARSRPQGLLLAASVRRCDLLHESSSTNMAPPGTSHIWHVCRPRSAAGTQCRCPLGSRTVPM